MPLRILYFGLPLGALLLHADGHQLVAAVLARKRALGARRLVRTLGAKRVYDPDDFARAAAECGPFDLLVSWFYPKKIDAALLRAGRYGAFGVHPSLLPRHRGADPYFAAIDQGDEITGVSAHRLEAEYDTGEILAQKTLKIAPSWNAWQLAKQLDRPSLQLLRQTAQRFAREGMLRGAAQDPEQASLAPEPSEAQLELNLAKMHAICVERRVRAAAPWPGAYVFVGEQCVVLEQVALCARAPRLLPGELGCFADAVWLGAADQALRIERVRLEDDTEHSLRGADLWRWAQRAILRAAAAKEL